MPQQFKSINLTSLVTGPGYNTKKGYLESTKILRNASKALDTFTRKWNLEIDPFLNTIPKYSDANPIVSGLSGSTLLLDNTTTEAHPFYWNSVSLRSKTILEALNEIDNTNSDIQQQLQNLQASISRLKKLSIKQKFNLLIDTPYNYFNNQFLIVKADETGLEATDTLTIPSDSTFLGIVDTPSTYSSSSDYLVVTKFDQSGLYFVNKNTIPNYFEASADPTISNTFEDVDSLNRIISITLPSTSETLLLEPTKDGVELILRLENTNTGDIDLSGSNCSIENEPLTLDNSNRFLHLIYHSSSTQYYVVGKE